MIKPDLLCSSANLDSFLSPLFPILSYNGLDMAPVPIIIGTTLAIVGTGYAFKKVGGVEAGHGVPVSPYPSPHAQSH